MQIVINSKEVIKMIKLAFVSVLLISLITTSVTAMNIHPAPVAFQPIHQETAIHTSHYTVRPEFGTIEIHFSDYKHKYLRVIIEQDDVYIYNTFSEVETFPLQMGSGEYTITILGSHNGQSYDVLFKDSIELLLDENSVFLNTSQVVSWHDHSDLVTLTEELIKNTESDHEKLEVIHNFIVSNVSYDHQKASRINNDYVPLPTATLQEKLGICYDFAALTASMLRIANIPTKLVKGYSTYTTVYHAWNEVYINNEWIVVDLSTDAIYLSENLNVTMQKNDANYSPISYY
jgi:hypothetical protein